MNLDTRVTDSDLSVILTYLSRYKGVIIYDDDASYTFSFFFFFFGKTLTGSRRSLNSNLLKLARLNRSRAKTEQYVL